MASCPGRVAPSRSTRAENPCVFPAPVRSLGICIREKIRARLPAKVDPAVKNTRLIPVLVAIVSLLSVRTPLHGQRFPLEGTVVAAGTGEPLEDVLVRAEASGMVGVTDDEGRFRLNRLPEGETAVSFHRFGYATDSVRVTLPTEEEVRVELELRPIELEGLEATATSFATRFARTRVELDRRLARLPGQNRAVDAATIRTYDEDHQSDPWKLLSRELDADWAFGDALVNFYGRKLRPEVYIDEKRTWLFKVTHELPSTFCRIELYVPPRKARKYRLDDRPPQIRAYTCPFMVRVAEGEEELSRYLSTEDLIAG